MNKQMWEIKKLFVILFRYKIHSETAEKFY